MATKSGLVQNFDDIGLDVEDDILEQCLELCKRYDIDESELVETWMAYTVSNTVDVAPTTEGLLFMEKKMLSKKKTGSVSTTPVAVYSATNNYSSTVDSYGHLDELTTPKSAKAVSKVSRIAVAHSPRMLFSPASFSPTAIQSSVKYSERTQSGRRVCALGNGAATSTWKPSGYREHVVRFADRFDPIESNARYMFESIIDRMQVLAEQTEAVVENILKANGLSEPVELHTITVESATFAGRIMCDSNGKLNASSILLENEGDYVHLQVSQCTEYSLFPGQIVVVCGTNPTGMKIVAERFYTNVCLPASPKPMLSSAEPLQIVVAAGPFTPSDTLSYEPLEDLLKYVQEHEPHVLILIGPIVDCMHSNVITNSMAETFSHCYDRILDNILQSLSKKHTKIVVVSSWREVGHHIVYPTPCANTDLTAKHKNLFLAPDPSIISVSGFNIGITSSDILMHLGKEEISCSISGMDRLSRLASHLLQQQIFYPLVPSAEEMSIDLNLCWEHALINVKPHMLILPSDLRYVVKCVDDCVVVNPERLTKGTVGGNFARIEILPDEDWTVEKHANVEIVKI